jgi:PAS domain S-box-containing protein
LGVLNVEFAAGDPRDLRADERVVIRVANQAALGLRNVKLLEEVSYVRRYLEQLIEHANALIVVVNAESQVIVFNQAMARLSGHRGDQVLGRPFLDFIPADEHPRVQRLVVRSLHGGPVANFETAMQHADGRKLRVAFSTAAVRSASGEIEGVIAVGQDLTQLKSLENQVIQAEKLSSLGQLAAGVAHEINNPLTTISIYADALGRKLRQALAMEATFEGADGPGKRPVMYGDASDMEKLGRIGEATDRIMKLSRDLTSYARPAPDGVEPVLLKDTLDRAVSFCDHVLKASGVELLRQYPPTLTVLGRRSQLVQVFVNLITNACHATGAGGVVTLQAEPGGPGAVVVRVKDTGSGIEAQHLAHLFEPFFTTKAEGKGTGLGLSIVQGIVTQHGGTVTVQSEPGHGTTFTVRLPSGDAAG